MAVTGSLNRAQNFHKERIGRVPCTSGVVMTEVGDRALELTGRTRFLDLQRLLGVEEVDEKRYAGKEEQEDDDEALAAFHFLLG
jgi:hypothetical protein